MKRYFAIDGSVYSTDDAEGRRGGRPSPPGGRVPADAIVIDRADLPEVTPDDSGYRVDNEWFMPMDADEADRYARIYAAIAAHLREHPPVDEDQVKALSDLMSDIDPNPHGWYKADSPMLREMVKRGVRVEVDK